MRGVGARAHTSVSDHAVQGASPVARLMPCRHPTTQPRRGLDSQPACKCISSPCRAPPCLQVRLLTSQVMFATGREPNSRGIGLEASAVCMCMCLYVFAADGLCCACWRDCLHLHCRMRAAPCRHSCSARNILASVAPLWRTRARLWTREHVLVLHTTTSMPLPLLTLPRFHRTGRGRGPGREDAGSQG